MDWIRIEQDPFDKREFTIDFRHRRPCDLTVRQAVDNYIDRIVDLYPPPYTIFASGGVDSQATILAWLQSGKKFDIVSIRYENDFNYHDIKYLEQFSKRHGVEINYLDFCVTEFLETQLKDYVYTYNCTSPQICTHMAFSELVPEGTVIFSGMMIIGSPMYGSEFVPELLGLYNYKKIKRNALIPLFFMEDQDVVSAFLNMQERFPKRGGEPYGYKIEYYKQAGYDIIKQEERYTGFEKIKEFYKTKPWLATPMEKMRWSGMPSKWTFDLAFRYKWYDDLGYFIKKTQLI